VRPHAQFVTSAAAESQFPPPSAPEIAFLGRSNVGKSSLLNALLGDRLARTSNTPGRTQTINFYRIDFSRPRPDPDLIFSDLPGYGYARVPLAIVGGWPAFIEPYLSRRPTLVLCVCLVDTNVPPQKSDRQLLDWLDRRARLYVVVGTKSDRISGNKLAHSLRLLSRDLGAEVLPVSARTGRGRDELWRLIRDAAKR
jgi:GTP-binding protein